MALIPEICLSESGDAKFIHLYDSTGIYDALSNPNGYGGANIEATDVKYAKMMFKFDSIAEPLILDFEISQGSPGTFSSVVSVTKTDFFGNVSNVDPFEFNIYSFPFPEDVKIKLPVEFFFEGIETFPDEYVTVTYTVGTDVSEFSSENIFLLSQGLCCCLSKTILGYVDGSISLDYVIKVSASLDSIFMSNAVGNIDAVRKEIKKATNLCNNCGCNK